MSFFVGDCSNSRSVYRGDYSLIERDERNRLRTTALERKQLCDKETAKRRKIQEKDRQRHLNLMNSAARKIQKCFGELKIFRMEQSKQRQEFLKIYEKMLLEDYRNAFGPNSVFLGQFLYFFNAKQIDDISVLKEICRLVLHFVGDDKIGDAFTLFAGHDYSSEPIRILVNFRMKKLAYVCIRALHHDGNRFKDENLSESNASDDLEKLRESNASDLPLLKVLILLIDLKQPWSCKMIKSLSHYRGRSCKMIKSLSHYRGLCLLGDIILRKKIISEKCIGSENGSCLEHLEHLRNIVNYHFGQKSCICSNNDQIYDFTSQIFTSPSLLRVFPNMRKIFARQGMVRFLISSLPKNIPDKLVHAIHRHIGNVFETGTVPSRGPGPYVIIDLAEVATFLLAAQPSLTRSDGRDRTANAKLDQQSCSSIDNGLFLDLTRNFLTEIYNAEEPCDRKVVAVGAVSAFLYVIFNTFPRERIILELDLAYQSDFIQVLWDFIKQCREGGKLSSLSYQAPDWLLPLAVFCSVYNNMLKILDHEKFYKLEKPLSLNDIKDLITLLKQTLWHLLWVNHNSFPNSVRSLPVGTSNKRLSVEAIQQEVIKVVSELLSQNYEGDISEFGLLGDEDEDELLPNIEELRIRNENFNIYIEIRANYRLNYQIRQQSSHFLRGFQQLIQKDWTDMFNEHELQLLISGSPSIDVDNLREHTTYDTVYHSGHPVIEMFWNVLREFSEPNKGKFLKFVTGCSRGPFLGFGDLVPLFSIQRVDGNDMGRLPTAATCANTLKLPLYESKNQLESKLLDAINSDAGFDLS